ncbi:MAG: hypothetical protein GY948_02275 [Alphaproteobacteria bacterium]|nr:hypothetical protein [Alphaproteobacteria bacterium]
MQQNRLETCRRLTGVDQSVEEILDDPVVRSALENEGVKVEELTDVLTALRTRLLAQRWRNAA